MSNYEASLYFGCPVFGDDDEDNEDVYECVENVVRSVSMKTIEPRFDCYVPNVSVSIAECFDEFADLMNMDLDSDYLSSVEPSEKVLDAFNDLLGSSFTPVHSDTEEQLQVRVAIVAPALTILDDVVYDIGPDKVCALSVGAGSGADIQRVAKAVGTAVRPIVDTIDLDDRYVDRVKKYRRRYMNIAGKDFVGDFQTYHFNRTYNLILFFNSIHYVAKTASQLSDAFSKMRTLLRPGGVILGVYPSLEGMKSMSSGLYDSDGGTIRHRSYIRLLYSEGDSHGDAFYSEIAGRYFKDYVLPPEALQSVSMQHGFLPEVWHSRAVLNMNHRTNMFKNLVTFPEHRAFYTFKIVKSYMDVYNYFLGEAYEFVPGEVPMFSSYSASRIAGMVTYYPRNKGRHITYAEVQFLTRTGPWYVTGKTDGVSGWCVIGRKGGYVLLDNGFAARFKCGYMGHEVVYQIEYANGKYYIVQLLCIDGVYPSNWWQSEMQSRSYLANMRKNGYLCFLCDKVWKELDLASIIWFTEQEGNDGVVIQLKSSPAPRILDGVEWELGNAYYFKNCSPFKVTYDIHVEVEVGFGDSPEPFPFVRNFPIGMSSGTFEVFKEDDQWVFVRRRENKKPNSAVTVARLNRAATLDEISAALHLNIFNTHDVELCELFGDGELGESYRWTRVQAVRLGITHPAKLLYRGSPVRMSIYLSRLSILRDIFLGNYDDVILSEVV